MAFRKKTLRLMSPTARKVARLCGELDSVSRRLHNLIPDLQRLDLESRALFNKRTYEEQAAKEVEGETEVIFEEPD